MKLIKGKLTEKEVTEKSVKIFRFVQVVVPKKIDSRLQGWGEPNSLRPVWTLQREAKSHRCFQVCVWKCWIDEWFIYVQFYDGSVKSIVLWVSSHRMLEHMLKSSVAWMPNLTAWFGLHSYQISLPVHTCSPVNSISTFAERKWRYEKYWQLKY